MLMRVENIETDKIPTKHATWLEWWEKQAEESADECFANDCPEHGKATVGAVVKKCNMYTGSVVDKKIFVAPLCEACSKREDTFYVEEYAIQEITSKNA